MKIVCNTCNAKYSIADEKVKGKVFKIRCKKCGESIVVRGDSQGEQTSETAPPPMPLGGFEEGEGDAETRVFDYSGYRSNAPSDNVWYIVVEGEQQGPFSAEQLSGFMDGNSLDADSFVWKEGFDDWLPIRDVPELAEKLGVVGTTEAEEDSFSIDQEPFDDPNAVPSTGGAFDPGSPSATDRAEAQSAFNSPFESGGGLFNNAADPETSAADVFSSAPSSPTDNLGGVFSNENTSGADSGGLFGGGGDEPSGGIDLFGEGGEDLGSSDIFGAGDQSTGPRINVQQAMTGQRNENSVLFSLSNLQALASGTQNSPGQTPDPVVTNTGGSEGSGLIDIRSLASSLKAESDNTMTGEEDFLAMGGGGFAPVLGAPVLAPSQQSTSKALIIGLAAAGAAVLAGIVLLAIFLLGGPSHTEQREQELAALRSQLEQLQKQGAQADSQQMAALQKQIEQKQEQHAQAEKKDKVEVSKKDEAGKDEADKKDDDEAKRRTKSASRGSSSAKSSSGRSSSSSSSAGSSDKSASASASSSGSSSKEEPSPARKAATSELDDLLGSGGGAAKAAKPKPPSGGESSGSSSSGGAGATLSRADVQNGMNSVAARVQACGGGESGTVTLKVVISSTGSVISASPTGAHAGTSVGNCAARAVRAARFPKSSQNLTVRYPFKL